MLPRMKHLKIRQCLPCLMLCHTSPHNAIFVGVLFYTPAREHKHKGRKLFLTTPNGGGTQVVMDMADALHF